MTSVGWFYGSSSEKQIGMVLVLVPHINSTRNLVLDLVFKKKSNSSSVSEISLCLDMMLTDWEWILTHQLTPVSVLLFFKKEYCGSSFGSPHK
jgi:hypothetical protein